MANNHVMTKDIGNLRGFSTDSSYLRPPNVADVAINMMRGADDSFQPRRGYQCQTSDIGGFGTGTFDDVESDSVRTVTINKDGLLYEKIQRQIYMYYDGGSTNRYLTFTIFTDPRFLTTNPGWSVAPWSLSPWGAPSGESITCQITVNRAARISSNQTNVNTLIVDVGHELAAGDIAQFADSVGNIQTVLLTGTTANSISFATPLVSVLAGTYVNQFFDIPFRRGFDTVAPYTIQTFISQITDPINGIDGLQISINGDADYPAAFLQLVEPTIIDSNNVFSMDYYYWVPCNKTVTTTFPGSANPAYQNAPDYENASFAAVDNVVYICNGIDFPQKFDGQTVYRVGMPAGDRPTLASAGAGKLASGNYSYGITYEQVDKVGHVVEGAISETLQINLTSGPNNVNVTVSNLLANSGWNTSGALAVGGLATVYGPDSQGYYYDLIPVTSNTLNVGDTAFYNDTVVATKNGLSSAAENTFLVLAGHGVEVGDSVVFLNSANDTQFRLVSEITDITITVEGVPVIVANNTTFSANKANLVFGNIAISDANQNNVNTISVSTAGASFTIQPGDIASFLDTEGRIQRRSVVSVGANSVTLAGIPVSIALGTLITTETIRSDQISVRRTNITGATLGAGAPISNNLRINIWRTAQEGTLLQLLATIPNDSSGPLTQTFLDTIQAGRKTGSITAAAKAVLCVIESKAHGLLTGSQLTISGIQGMIELNDRNYTITVIDNDNFSLNGVNASAYTLYTAGGTWTLIFTDNSQLGPDFPDPIRRPDPPPVSKYLLEYGNQLLYAGGKRGDPTNDDNVFFSEGNQPESVPAATNFFSLPATDDVVTGIGIAGTTLIASKNKSIYAVTGDLLTSQFQVTPISAGSNIGCVAFATMKSVGSLLYFLHTSGVYAISENQFYPTDKQGKPVAISEDIQAIFRESEFLAQNKLVFKRAVAVNYTLDDQYILYLPAEDKQATQRAGNLNSIILMFDHQRNNWFKWLNINAAGGMYVVDDNLYFHERRISGFVGLTANLYKQHRFYRLIDYADHTSALSSEWRSSWMDFGLPQVRKKFSHCLLYMDRYSDLQQFNNPQIQFATYIDRVPNLKNTMVTLTTVNNNANAGWSQTPWGWNQWAGIQDSFIRINLKGGTVAKSIQVGFSLSAINASYKLSGFDLEAIPEFRRAIVR